MRSMAHFLGAPFTSGLHGSRIIQRQLTASTVTARKSSSDLIPRDHYWSDFQEETGCVWWEIILHRSPKFLYLFVSRMC